MLLSCGRSIFFFLVVDHAYSHHSITDVLCQAYLANLCNKLMTFPVQLIDKVFVKKGGSRLEFHLSNISTNSGDCLIEAVHVHPRFDNVNQGLYAFVSSELSESKVLVPDTHKRPNTGNTGVSARSRKRARKGTGKKQ